MYKSNLVVLFFFFSICCQAQQRATAHDPINGEWLVELKSNDIGLVQTIFTFDTKDSTFTASTRKGASEDILGFWKASLAKIFTDDFKNGSLMRLTDGIIEQKTDTFILKGIFRSAIGHYHFKGRLFQDTLIAQLLDGKMQERGTILATKSKAQHPLANYSNIVSQALEITGNKIFNRAITQTKEWKKFDEQIREVSTKCMDDVEMVFVWYYFASKLPLSHYALVKMDQSKNKKNSKEIAGSENVLFEEKSSETAYLKIKSFGGTAAEMDSVFTIINKGNYKNLIVDLRNNSGGSVEAGMAFAENVLDTTLIGGIFLTQRWFSAHDSIPTKEQYDQFPFFSQANFELLVEGIHREKGLVLKVVPNEENIQTKLFVLTNKHTASTCEPIVYALKASKRATIVGERTAGAMLNGEIFELSDGFSLIVPTADYYSSDGFRIDQNGVEPTIEVEPQNALEYVMQNL